MAKTIIATFPDKFEVNHAIERLLDYGFRNDELSVVKKDGQVARADDLYDIHADNAPRDVSFVEGTATGIVLGGIFGGVVGFLTGVGFMGAVYGAVIGGVLGLILGIFTSDEDIEEAFDESTVLALPVTEKQEYEVKDLIAEAGASDIKILDLKPYEDEEQYRDYYGVEHGYGLAGVKGGKRKAIKNDKYDDEF